MHTSQSPSYWRRQPSSGVLEHDISVLGERIRNRSARIAVLGLGYAGLPMAVELARAGFAVTGLDIDEKRVNTVSEGRSPVSGVTDTDIAVLVEEGRLAAASHFDALAEADCALICVPTPLTSGRKPDLHFVEAAARSIAAYVHRNMLVILQSTCSPGTTRRTVLPVLVADNDLMVGKDLFLAFAPERIDPGNRQYTVSNTPKLVGGITPQCSSLASLLFSTIVEHVVVVSSSEVAEMSKLIENTFRFINISFVNEMALLCDRMGIDIWEVIEAASTKPFAFMPHYPGPGVGGHCIPVVPFYLEAAAREYGTVAELVEAAGRINDEMPRFVVAKLERLLAERGRSLTQSRILLIGIAYKPDVSDCRESPGQRVLDLLVERDAQVAYYDPHVPEVSCGSGIFRSLAPHELDLEQLDCAVLLTAHSDVDHEQIASNVGLFFDTRNHLRVRDDATIVRI